MLTSLLLAVLSEPLARSTDARSLLQMRAPQRMSRVLQILGGNLNV